MMAVVLAIALHIIPPLFSVFLYGWLRKHTLPYPKLTVLYLAFVFLTILFGYFVIWWFRDWAYHDWLLLDLSSTIGILRRMAIPLLSSGVLPIAFYFYGKKNLPAKHERACNDNQDRDIDDDIHEKQKKFSIAGKVFFLIKNISQTSVAAQIRSIADTNYFVFAFSGLLGALFFIHVYGTVILNTAYTDWLMIVGGDTNQHYLGWEMFRNSDWHFPIGLSLGSTYPFRESIIFSDSIPLFAIFFKAVSFLLPIDFQYFGLFGILAHVLQGGFAGLIIKKLTGNTTIGVIGSLFFTMSSFMMWRMFAHTSLAAHFIILAAFYVCITKDKDRRIVINTLAWGGLLSLAASIHAYFVVMVFIIMTFYFFDDICEYKKIKKTIIEFSLSMAMLVITMYLIGFFYSGGQRATGGLGYFSGNINSIVNPGRMSRFLRALPLSTSGQYEGNAYIGYGMIIFIFITLFTVVDNFKLYSSKLSEKKIARRVILCVAMFIVFYILTLSPVVSFNDRTLFTYSVPTLVSDIWSIFRASGRFIWPNVYIVMIAVICITAKKFGKTASILMLVVLVFVQYQDMSDYFERKGSRFREESVWETNLESEMWSVIASDFDHLFYTDGIINMYPVLRFAAQNQMTVNDTEIARKDYDLIGSLISETWSNLHDGITEDNKVYFFQTMPVQLILNHRLFVYEFDGIIAGFSREIETAKYMDGVIHHVGNDFNLGLHHFGTQTGEVTDRGLQSDGSSGFLLYGPLMQLPQGLYEAEIRLSLESFTLDDVGLIEVVTQMGEYDITSLPIAAGSFLYATQTFSLPFLLHENTENIEFRVWTSDGTVLTVEDVVLRVVYAY